MTESPFSSAPGAVPSEPSDRWDAWTWDILLFRQLEAMRPVLFDAPVAPGVVEKIGILPAVYFPGLRMGSILAARWEATSREYTMSAPEGPPHVPPPYSCFVPKTKVSNVGLITKIAQIYDAIEETGAPPIGEALTFCEPLQLWIGTTSWTRRSTAFVLDSHLLHRMAFQTITTIYMLPKDQTRITYIPLLYLESREGFAPKTLEARVAMLAMATPQSPLTDAAATFQSALTSVAHATRLRAREWLNPKSLLLSQSGLNAVRRDLLFRMRDGERYAACFFDIDGFKALNDEIGYTAADDVAKSLAERTKRCIHEMLHRDVEPFVAEADRFEQRGLLEFPEPFTPSLAAVHPSGFAAYLAHVSGDEFKFFIRIDPPPPPLLEAESTRRVGADEPPVADALANVRARLEAVVGAAREPLPRRQRDERQRQPATISLGWAIIGRQRAVGKTSRRSGSLQLKQYAAWRRRNASQNIETSLENTEAEDSRLRSIAASIREADTLAERALEGAKYRGKDRQLLFDELLYGGGVVLEVLEDQVRLSVGGLDGVSREQEFDVFRRSAALAQRLISEDRRYWREPHQWIARVRVHQVWPRESAAYVVVGALAKLQKYDWIWLATSSGIPAPAPATSFDS